MTPFHTCYLMKVSQLSEPKKQYFVANQTNETIFFNPRHCALVWSMCSPERKIQSFEFFNLSILFLLFTFCRDMLVVHYQIEIQKLLKNCHPFWEAWGISCKYLSKDIELYCFSKETPKNGYIPSNFFKSLLFDILTQNPALICLTNSLLWKLHSHPSVLPICTNSTDDNIRRSELFQNRHISANIV